MTNSADGEDNLLLNEISRSNVPVKRRCFPKESSHILRQAMDDALSLVLSMYKASPLAFDAHAIFVVLPRLVLRPPPSGCQGGLAAASLSRRCSLLREGDIDTLLKKAHEAQSARVAKALVEASAPKASFSKTMRAVILARAGAVGRASKLALSYGM